MNNIHYALFSYYMLFLFLSPLLALVFVDEGKENKKINRYIIILAILACAAMFIDGKYIYPKTPEGMEKAKLESMSVDYESGVGNGEKIASDFYLKQIKYNNDLYYDGNTGVVYIKITNPKGPDTVSNYYSANGKICKYDPETNTISEME